MSQILLPQRFLSQPQYYAPVDYSGLGKGVRLLFNPAIGPIDIATGRTWTPGGNAAVVVGQKGKEFYLDGSGDYYAYTGYPEISGNVGTFFMWLPRVGAPDSFGHIYFVESTGAVYHQVTGSAGVFCGGTGGSGFLSSWFNTTNRSFVLSSDGTAARTNCFLDGKGSGITWGSAPKSWSASSKSLRLGNYGGGGSWDTDASILIAGFTTAVWGESEAKAFHENPWLLFKAPARRLWQASAPPISSSIPVFINHYRNQGIM